MDLQTAKSLIGQALAKTLGREGVEWSIETDLIEDEVLDSLDSVVFVLQLQELSGTEFPTEELCQPGGFRVEGLIKRLMGVPYK
jgi:acyl carrier protein